MLFFVYLQFQSYQRNFFVFSTVLAFLWPMKKKKEVAEQISNSTGTPLLILDTADNLFESGHYEQCYELLKEYEVLKEKNLILYY